MTGITCASTPGVCTDGQWQHEEVSAVKRLTPFAFLFISDTPTFAPPNDLDLPLCFPIPLIYLLSEALPKSKQAARQV